MNDAEYFHRRAAQARSQAERAVGYARDIHLDLAQRYAERERVAARRIPPAPSPAL